MTSKSSIFLAIGFLLTIDVYGQFPEISIPHLRQLLATSSPDTNRVKTLLQLGHTYIFKPGEQAHDLDSAILLSQQAYNLSRLLGYKKGEGLGYLTVAQAHREKGNLSLGKQYAQRAVSLLDRYGSPEDQADAYIEQATYFKYWQAQDLANQIRLYERIIPLLQQTTNQLKLANALKFRGDLYQIGEEYPRSLLDLHQALVLYQSIGYKELNDLYDLMGIVYALQNKYVEALRYGLLSLKLADQRSDTGLYMSTTYFRLGRTYHHLSQYKQAWFFFSKALVIAQKFNNKDALLQIKFGMANMHSNQHQLVKALQVLQEIKKAFPKLDIQDQLYLNTYFIIAYYELDQAAKAKPYAQRLLTLEKELINKQEDDYTWEILYHGLGYYFILSHQNERARHYFLLSESIFKQKHKLRPLAKIYYQLFRIDSARARYATAIGYYQRYKAAGDSILNETNSQQLQLLDVQYQTKKKEQNIRLLRQQSQLQQADLQTAQTIRNFSIVGGGLLILLLGTGYNRYRLKQRSNQLLEAKQFEINQKNESLTVLINEKDQFITEKEGLLIEKDHLLEEKEWLLKEIHHRVKNNLQIITSLLHSQGAYLKDQTAISAIRESQNRVHTMALIHQKLYQSDRLAAIPIANYVAEILDYLIQSFDRQDTVTTHIDIPPFELDVTQAIPLGLIINEAVTNSLKYAFPGDQSGTISIELMKLDSLAYQLTLRDDGIGLPAELNPVRSRTLGMSLIRGLSKQIGGKLEISHQNGVKIRLTFTVERIGNQELVKN